MIERNRFQEVCERAGLEIVAMRSKRWSVEFRRTWRAVFAAPEVEWKLIRSEWEALDTKIAPALARRAAVRKFDELRELLTSGFITSSLDYAEVYEFRGRLPGHEWWRKEIGASDLYIVESNWRWSFVMTHEEELGIGPFLVLRLENETDPT